MNFKEDFPMLNNNIIYFDNGATSLKPKSVIEKMNDYYYNYSSNAHRGDYKISIKASSEYENVRTKVKEFINANNEKEIIFTSGATESLNEIVYGYFKNNLKKGDEVLTTKAEHASVILPWFNLENEIGIKVKFSPLDKDYSLNTDDFINNITDKTKVIAITHITNVIGDIRDINRIIKEAHKRNILVVIDASQSIGHIKVDVKESDVDFFVFSAHKMLGPTGVGILYGKEKYLNELKPFKIGGGMNISFYSANNIVYKELPYKLEAGTQNIAGVIGLGAAIDYINKITIDYIEKKDNELREYLINKLEKLKNITIYNKNTQSSIIIFNVNGVFSQDTALYLDKYNIAIRSGSHCAKKLSDEIGINNTCRISLYFYNTKEEIDKLITVLDNDKILEESIGV